MAATFRPSRRFFLKQATTGAVALGLLPLVGCAAPAWGAETKAPAAASGAAPAKGAKPLVVYFSHSGNTRKLAELIHNKVGGDLIEIVPEKPYPADYQATVDQAKREQQENARPAVKTKIDPAEYGVIFLGYPNWWSSMPMPVWTFVEQSGLDGKTIAPFDTHGGGGLGHSEADLKKLVPHSRVLKGLAVRGTRAGDAEKDVEKWLEGLGNALIMTTTGNPAIYPDGGY